MPANILIVDDDHSTTTLARSGLEKAGFKTMTAHDGDDALKKISLRCPDIILTDVNMPQVDGVDLLMKIKEMEKTKETPVIIMTTSHHMEENFKKIGISYFICKPFNIDELVNTINKIIKRHHIDTSYKGMGELFN